MDCMLRAGLDWGKDVVRGDVQTRLFGGAAELVGRLVRFSGAAMAMIISVVRGQERAGESDGEAVNRGARETIRGSEQQIETSETSNCLQ